jgi:hypothetical protein
MKTGFLGRDWAWVHQQLTIEHRRPEDVEHELREMRGRGSEQPRAAVSGVLRTADSQSGTLAPQTPGMEFQPQRGNALARKVDRGAFVPTGFWCWEHGVPMFRVVPMQNDTLGSRLRTRCPKGAGSR